MEKALFVRAIVAPVVLSVVAAQPVLAQNGKNQPINDSTTVPSSITDALGPVGSGGGGGPNTPSSGGDFLSGTTGTFTDPVGTSGIGHGAEVPAMVPLPPAVISGLVGLAAVGLIARLRRKSLAN